MIVRILKILGAIILSVLVLIGSLYLVIFLWSSAMPPLKPVAITSTRDPAAGYADAMARFDALLAAEQARGDLDEKCLPFVLTHGDKTARAIILLHGLTACPFQYRELGQQLFDQGYNVFVPRLPGHGLADRTSNALGDLTAEELLGVLDPAVDLATGLGDAVTLAGLSLGGNVAAAGGQLRPDLALAAPISPAFGLRVVPDFLTPALTRVILGLPDIYIWWDPINKANFQAESGYPGFSSHALGEIFRLGLSLREAAKASPALAQNLLMVTNVGDPAVNLAAADGLVDTWRQQGRTVETYRFPLLPWLPHDIVSTDAVGANTAVTYPELLKLLTGNPE